MFAKDLRKATSVHSVNGNEKGVYEATKWRGNWSMRVEVEG